MTKKTKRGQRRRQEQQPQPSQATNWSKSAPISLAAGRK